MKSTDNKEIMFNFKNKFDMKNKSSITRKARYFLYALLAVVLLFGYPAAYYISSETVEITIKDKERITTGSGENISSKLLFILKMKCLKIQIVGCFLNSIVLIIKINLKLVKLMR